MSTKKRKLKRLDKETIAEMYANEAMMKNKGKKKAMKSILTKDGKFKNVSNTQKGQKIILDEALRIFPMVVDWINNKSGLNYRKELKKFFEDDDFLLQKIVECFLYMSGTIYAQSNPKAKSSRHKKVNSIQEKLMPDLSFENVWRFLEIIISFSNYFDTEVETGFEKNRFKKNFKYTCSLGESILDEVTRIAVESFYPLPIENPPLDWKLTDEGVVGGYETYQYEMVRSGKDKIDYTKFGQKVFDSINYIQSVPWRVNGEVLNQLKADLKAPTKTDFVKSEYPDPEGARWDIDLTAKTLDVEQKLLNELMSGKDKTPLLKFYNKKNDVHISLNELNSILLEREIYKDRAALYNAEVSDYESAVGKYRYAKLAVSIAEKYVEKTIYFPHSFDFRGRIYPLPIGLSPQGSDAIKALLLYANEERLTKSGLQWCWAYMASLWGDDKLPFKQRIKRGKELIDADYKEADEPYQFLSHQLEMKKYLENPDYRPSVRIHLDACNSGSQFTSAITGDLAGCKATNVIPSLNGDGTQNRQDAYILVANKSIELCKDILLNPNEKGIHPTIEFFLSLLNKKGRKICKVPVMVSNYGGTAGGRASILWDMMRELGVERKWITKKNASLFSKVVGNSITGVLNGGKAFEAYIHAINNCIARHNKPVVWTTSDGFHVVHKKNKELKPKKVYCKIPGSRGDTVIKKKVYSDYLSSVKMKSAVSPNYIHSLDAELLRRVAMRMKNLGIIDTDWIHDSFGAHPNHVDKLLEVTKEEFLSLMLNNPLKTLDKQLRSQVPDDKNSQKELSLIPIPSINGFTDEENLKKVLESDWFFS